MNTLSFLEFLDAEYDAEFGEEIDIEEGRIQKVNRVRGGKIQRNKKVASKAGYTMRGGKVKRMSATERRKRSLSQKKASRKRRGKLATSLRKRKLSMKKGRSLPGRRR